MNENSPIWASATATVTDALNGYPTAHTSTSATNGLPTSTIASAPSTSAGDCSSAAGASSMPTETKNSTANASRLGRGAQAVLRSPDDHPREKCAEGHRHAEDVRGSDRDAERQHQHRQREQL